MKTVFSLTTLTLATLLYAEFPSAYYPTEPHPRLWLTTERLTAIEKAKTLNNERWVYFKEMCDSIIDTDITNDPYGLDTSPQNFTAPLALMYRLSGNTTYADKAMDLMDKTSLDLSQYGDADHESFYFLALTYDWLYDYSKMSDKKKSEYHDKMVQLSDKFWPDYNLNASGTDSDSNLLTGNMHLTFGAALYGDFEDAVTLLDRGWMGWDVGYFTNTGTSNRDMIKEALGGVYFTGMAYFPSTDIVGITGYEMTLSTACGYDINVKEPELKPFWSNTIRAIISLTEPTRERICDYGSWQDPNILEYQPWLRRTMILLSYFAKKSGDSTTAALADGYSAAVNIGDYNDYFLELFFSQPESVPVSPYTAGLPLVHFAKSPDFLLFRDRWGVDANWGIFRGNGSVPLDQQAMDQGHFSLWRGDGYLTKGARNYEALSHGDFFNTLSIENACTLNGEPCSGTAIFNSEKPAAITRNREQDSAPLFAYAMLNADGQWNDNPSEYEAKRDVKTYRRHFFWTDDYVVIFDRLRNKIPLWSKYRLRALTEPLISGDTVTQLSTNGKYKLLQRTLEPSDVTINKINEADEWNTIEDWVVNLSERKWQSVIDLPASRNTNILNVIQTGSSSMTHFDTLEHLSSTENSGVRIGNWVVSFSVEENLRTAVHYTIKDSTSGMWHLITDLQAGSYKILENGKQIKMLTVKEGDNTALFQTQSASSSLTVQLEAATMSIVPTLIYLLD